MLQAHGESARCRRPPEPVGLVQPAVGDLPRRPRTCILHPVKLAHIADPHLGARQYHRQTPTGINQREADVAQAFRAAVDGVIAARPEVVVVAGDLFHTVRPTNAAIVFAFRQFQRLREALPEAPIVLIAGNHDTPRSSETGSILRLFNELASTSPSMSPGALVFPELDLAVLAVPHQALLAPERPLLRPEGNRAARCWCSTARSRGCSPSTGAASSTAARSSPAGISTWTNGPTWPWATTTCSTRWRRGRGTPARWTT